MGYLAEIILWDISSIGSAGNPKLLYRLRLHKVQVQALDFSHSGKYLASIGGSDDNNLVIWNVLTGKAVRDSACEDADLPFLLRLRVQSVTGVWLSCIA